MRRPKQNFIRYESKIWSDEEFEQKLEDYLTPRGQHGTFTWYADGYRALGLFGHFPESRAALHGALQRRDRKRRASWRQLPLCVLMRARLEEEHELTRRLLIELGYLQEGDDPDLVCSELRRKWKTRQTDGLQDSLL